MATVNPRFSDFANLYNNNYNNADSSQIANNGYLCENSSFIDSSKALISDSFNQIIESSHLDFIKQYMPEQAVSFITNKSWCRNIPIEKQLENLPRLENGEFDINKIREGLSIAQTHITNKNLEAKKILNYGLHRKNINGFDLWLLAMPPEIAHTLEKTGVINEHRLQTFGTINTIISNLSDNKEIQAINNELNPKDSQTIENSINTQNKELEDLASAPLNTKEEIVHFLKEYQRITGTSFSYEDIKQSSNIINNDAFPVEDRAKEYLKSFGFPENYIDAHKNKIITDVIYSVGLKYALPKALTRVPTGIFWAPAIPFGIEAGESFTKGTKDNQIINTDNITIKETARIHIDGLIRGGLVMAPPVPFWQRHLINACNWMQNKLFSF